jgi:DNA polymerase-3 subunit beta
MKVRFNREEIAAGLGVVCNVAASRTPKPILQCVRLEAYPDYVLLSATDLELGVRWAVSQVEVDEPGETLVVADMLARIVRESADELLAVETAGSELHVRGEDSHFQIRTQDPSEFPPVPVIEGEPDFTMDYGQLRRLVEWTSYAAARESTRYAINGILWEVRGERVTLAATDGRRLARACGGIASGISDLTLDAIVPVKALSLVSRLSEEPDVLAGVKITGNQFLLQVGPVSLSSSLVEGRFPKHQEVVPTDSDKEILLDTLEFQSALRRASLLTSEQSKGVRLSFSDNRLTLSSRAPEQGEVTIGLSVEYRGEPMEIGFNPVFLLEVLRVAHTEKVSFLFKEPNRPGVVRLNDDFVYVVMPVSLS